MKASLNSKKVHVGVAVLAFSLLLVSPAWSAKALCPDVPARGYINVLTINLLFSEIEDRELRLKRIANFVAQETQQGNPIDIILLQEVVGGAIEGTDNSSLDLKTLLAAKKIPYNFRFTMVNGLPGILSVGNSILSRCEIKSTLTMTLPFESEEVFQGLDVPLKRKVIMVRIDVPGFGRIDVYDTHLCSGCSGSERLQQAKVLMKFVQSTENRISGENPVILGGDFNTDLNLPGNPPVYNLVTGNGFVDTYAAFNGCSACCTPPGDVSGCTFAVPGDPYASDLITHQTESPQRIDYIFVKGFNAVLGSEVPFKGDSLWVSDHSGVLSRISLP